MNLLCGGTYYIWGGGARIQVPRGGPLFVVLCACARVHKDTFCRWRRATDAVVDGETWVAR